MYHEFVTGNTKTASPLKDNFKGVALGSDKFIEQITARIKSIG